MTSKQQKYRPTFVEMTIGVRATHRPPEEPLLDPTVKIWGAPS